MVTPPFIDSLRAAELLNVSPETVLEWVAEGKLQAYAGPPAKPFLRSRDVLALASEIGASATETPQRVKGPFARVQTRITADARWSEISLDDVDTWFRRADRDQRLAARKVVVLALDRLEIVRRLLNGIE